MNENEDKPKPPYKLVPICLVRSKTLNVYEKIIFLILQTHGKHIYPSYTSLCEDSGLSRPTVARTIKSLQKKGYITIISGCTNRSNQYFIHFEPKRRVSKPTENQIKSITGDILNRL